MSALLAAGASPPRSDWIAALEACVERSFVGLGRPVRRNLVAMTVAFFGLLGAGRSGHGELSLAALARFLPTLGTAHARQKRLHRFLDNVRFDPRGVTDGLVRLIVGRRGRGLWPVLFDQTRAGATQALVAGVPFEGRTLPLAVYTFDYPWQETAARSQNELEEVFLTDVETALGGEVRPVFIGDRGYARATLLRHCQQAGRLFILRGRAGTCVELDGCRSKLGELAAPASPVRYRRVLYQAELRVEVDVVAVCDPQFEEPWWLLVPAGCEDVLPTDAVVALYRERMQVEQSFRDFKTHLGLRGLKLQRRIAARTGRLLLAFCLAYALALVVGSSAPAHNARQDLEIPRRRPRHGTRRTLSAFYLALVMLSHPRWCPCAYRVIQTLALQAARDRPLLARPPPILLPPRQALA